ncbi:SDR family oxidoreductase [bacterium]|jgi:NAD(P)-dependent dehydrogenase (short-subunit alcohol dehydrogenase family)|nr:SDR family oxidoreductase [bacterium]
MIKILRLIRNLLKCLKRGSAPVQVSINQIQYDKMYENKNILITGGTSGIGLSIAKKFLSLGAKVTITGRDINRLNGIKEEINDSNLFVVEWDISKQDLISKKVDESIIKMGSIDILFNNSGIYSPKSFFDTDEKLFDNIMDTNLKGLYFTSKKIAEYFIQNKIKGKIINISSITSITGASIPYGVSKWGVRGVTQGLARDLIKYGIIVNAIAPGVVATAINPELSASENMYRAGALSQRASTPEEIAEIAVFLSSEAATNIIGQTIVCDGGETLI